MPTRRVRIPLLLLAPLLAAIALGAGLLGSADARRGATADRTASATASKAYSAKLSYVETNHGHAQGAATVGIQGKGKFSAKLGPHGALEAAVIALATGVPVSKIAQGATYKVVRQIAGNGDVKGLAVVKFKAHGLGTLCVSLTGKQGKFDPAGGFFHMSGSVTTVGGTGAAKTWHGGLGFKWTNVAGSSTEQFGLDGSEHASVGKAHGLSSACKRVH
jgi:hypothetical protein